MRIAYWLHLLATVIWVGGMFFAHVALRPAVQALPTPQRCSLMASALSTFFGWVAAAVVLMLASGLAMLFAGGGFAAYGPYVDLMTALGLLMTAIHGFVVAVPLVRLRAAVALGAWEAARDSLAQVRRLVGINLILGFVTLTIATLGHDVV